MTPQERARKVVEDVRDHKMFNVDTDGTWERYIASAIKNALDESLPDANDLDEVVHVLGIEDSDTAPAEAVKNLQTELIAWRNVARRAGICMSCALGAHEPFGCTDCLNTGWNGGAPTGFIPELPREPGTCKCGAAPVNKDGMCATCADEKPGPIPLWKAFHARNIAVERDGNLVIFTIRCSSYYEAIEVYDGSRKALAETGTLQLCIEAQRDRPSDDPA